MFIFHINDIVKVVQHCKITLFAVDCVLYQTGNIWSNVYNTLQQDLDNITAWLNEIGLTLNIAKTKSLIIGTRTKLNDLENTVKLTIDGSQIAYVNQYDYLGTIFDSAMSLIPLYKRIVKKC